MQLPGIHFINRPSTTWNHQLLVWIATALPNHDGGGNTMPGFISWLSLHSIPTGGFQHLHCFTRGIMVKILVEIVSRGSQGEVEHVNREHRQWVARAVGFPSAWEISCYAAERRHSWEMWARGGKGARQLIAQAWHFSPYSIRGICSSPTLLWKWWVIDCEGNTNKGGYFRAKTTWDRVLF